MIYVLFFCNLLFFSENSTIVLNMIFYKWSWKDLNLKAHGSSALKGLYVFRIGLCWWMDGSETDHYVYFYLFAGLFWHWKRIWSAIRYWAKVHFPLWSCSNMNEILNISIPAVQIWAFAIKYHSIFSLTYSFSQSLTCSLTLFVTSLLTHRLYRLALSFTHSAENNENLLCCCPLLEYAEAIGSVTCRSAHYLDTHTQCV